MRSAKVPYAELRSEGSAQGSRGFRGPALRPGAFGYFWRAKSNPAPGGAGTVFDGISSYFFLEASCAIRSFRTCCVSALNQTAVISVSVLDASVSKSTA